MTTLHLGLCRLWLSWHAWSADRRRGDRGDVPGWVLVTVMSVGLVVAIWGVARGELTSMLRTALNSVK